MFTFKKIALVGAVALTALSMSCSDDKDDGDKLDTPTAPSYKFNEPGEATIGGIGSKYGSSIDLDLNKVYKVDDLKGTVINDVDLVFDATNIWVPLGIAESEDESIKTLVDKFKGTTSGATIFDAKDITDGDGLVEAMWEALPVSMGGDGGGVLTSIIATSGKTFGVITSSQNLAYVTVKAIDGEKSAKTIKLTVSLVKKEDVSGD